MIVIIEKIGDEMNKVDVGEKVQKKILLLFILIIMCACGQGKKEVKPEDVMLAEYPHKYSVDNLYYKKGTWELATGRYEGKFHIGQFVEGIAIGHHKRFLVNGQTLTENNYNSQGEKDGYQREYYRSHDGQIKSESFYKDGIEEDTGTEWYPNGQVYKVEEWKDGKIVNDVVMYYEDGSIKGKINYESDGKAEIYHKNGNLKEKYTLKNGVEDGMKETFYEDGKKRFVGKYIDGKLVEAIGWHGNGQVAIEKKDNMVRMYRYEGSLLYEMDLDKEEGYYIYNPNQRQYIALSETNLIWWPWAYDGKGRKKLMLFMPKYTKVSFWRDKEKIEYNDYGQASVIQKTTGIEYNELGLITSSYENDSKSKEKNRINYYYNDLGQVTKVEFASGKETDGWIGHFEYNEKRELIASYFDEKYNEDNVLYREYYTNNIGKQEKRIQEEYGIKGKYIVEAGNNNFEYDENGRFVREYREGKFEIIKKYNKKGMYIKKEYNELSENLGIVNIRNFEYDNYNKIILSSVRYLNVDKWEEKIAYEVEYDEIGRILKVYSDVYIAKSYPEKIQIEYFY